MPLPFILGGIAIAAAATGAKKAYDGYQDSSLADDIVNSAKNTHKQAQKSLEIHYQFMRRKAMLLEELYSNISDDFQRFDKILQSVVSNTSEKEQVIKMLQKRLNFSGKISTFSYDSTNNSMLKSFGLISAFGIANVAVLFPPLFFLGFAGFFSHASNAKKNLAQARRIRDEVDEMVEKVERMKLYLTDVSNYIGEVYDEVRRIANIFHGYIDILQVVEESRAKGSTHLLDPETLTLLGNGVAVAAILSKIRNTPLFKIKSISTNEEAVYLENQDGLPMMNDDEMKKQIIEARNDMGQL